MEQVFNEPLHFTTCDQPLAYALHTIGFKLLAIFNRYTDARLDHLRMPTADAAKKAGKPGNIEYVFERREDIEAAIDAWNVTGEALKAGNAIQNDCQAAEAIAVVRATLSKMRQKEFENKWLETPWIYLQPTGSNNGFKVITENMTEEHRQKLNL